MLWVATSSTLGDAGSVLKRDESSDATTARTASIVFQKLLQGQLADVASCPSAADQLEATSAVYLFGGGLIGALFGIYTRPHFDRCRSRVQGPLATAENSLAFEPGDQGAGVVVQGPALV